MSEVEISLTRAYLDAAGHDPVTALIRSVRDLAIIGQVLAALGRDHEAAAGERCRDESEA